MEFNAPMAVEQIKEIQAVYDMNERINPIGDAENLGLDLFTGTATAQGIARRESLYGILPGDTDSLEDRRYRVLVKENDRIPYTLRTLQKKLSTLCGEDGYRLSHEGDVMTVKVELSRKSMFDDVCSLLEDIVPCNLVLNVGLLYNQYGILKGRTYRELAGFTYAQIREEVVL